MNIGIRQSRILAPSLSKTLSLAPHRQLHTNRKLNIKFPTSSLSHSYGTEGNLGIAPKGMPQIQNLTLNDGNEIPLVQYPSREQTNTLNTANHLNSLVMALEPPVQHIDRAERT
jgi:hypothetical protein